MFDIFYPCNNILAILLSLKFLFSAEVSDTTTSEQGKVLKNHLYFLKVLDHTFLSSSICIYAELETQCCHPNPLLPPVYCSRAQ